MAKRKEFNKGLWCIIVFGVSIVVMISCLSFAFIHNEKQTCGIVEDIRDNKIVIIEDDSEDPDVITIEKPKIIKY